MFRKCLNSSASETPAASASARVVVVSNPLSTNTVRAARMIAARRSSPDIFEEVFMERPGVPEGKYTLTYLRRQPYSWRAVTSRRYEGPLQIIAVIRSRPPCAPKPVLLGRVGLGGLGG